MGSSTKSSLGLRFFLSLFGLAFLGMGSLFTWMILSDTYESYLARDWPEVPCVISDSGVEAVEDGYEFRVAYTYEFGERPFASSRYRLGDGAVFDEVAEADARARTYFPGAETTCYVDPEQPGRAILEHKDLTQGLMALFPMIFVVVGAGILYAAWFGSFTPRRRSRSASGDGGGGLKGRLMLAGFFMIFFLAGAVVGFAFFFPALVDAFTADDWRATPCTILSSRVKTHDSSDGDTYSVDILYTYTIGGVAYRSNRYGFMGGSSSGYKGKRKIVDRYPPGAEAVCYVNPVDPSEAVLSTALGGMIWFALIPLVFMVVGGGGVLYALFAKAERTPTYPGRRPAGGISSGARPGISASTRRSPAGTQVLAPKTSVRGKIIGTLFVAVFWNGITSVFVVLAIRGWMDGEGSIFLTLFMVPFVLVGLFLIVGFFHSLMAAFNPRVTITLHSDALRLGDEVKLHWAFTGNPRKIQRFTLTLTGTESATYIRGTDRTTDHHTFHETNIVEHTDTAYIRRGYARLKIPRESMHSFESDNNAVTWGVRVHCDVPNWPDTKDEYPIDIGPLREGPWTGGTPWPG